MRKIRLPSVILLAATATLALALPLRAYDDLGVPPKAPAGSVIKPLTSETIQTELDRRLIDRFRAAAGTSPRLTAQQAKDAGWGFIADHFAEIDKRRYGYVTFDEIQDFMDSRALGNPGELRAKTKAAATKI